MSESIGHGKEPHGPKERLWGSSHVWYNPCGTRRTSFGGATSSTGERLVLRLEKLGMSKSQLAEESGVSYRTICRITSGDRLGNLDTWMRICSAIGCEISDLVG